MQRSIPTAQYAESESKLEISRGRITSRVACVDQGNDSTVAVNYVFECASDINPPFRKVRAAMDEVIPSSPNDVAWPSDP